MKKGAKVKWFVVLSRCWRAWLTAFHSLYRDDEQASIQKYFSGEALGPQKAALWKDFALSSVGAF